MYFYETIHLLNQITYFNQLEPRLLKSFDQTQLRWLNTTNKDFTWNAVLAENMKNKMTIIHRFGDGLISSS